MMADCEICGQPLPPGEETFLHHGYSGKCPAPAKREWRERPFKETGQIIVKHHAKVATAKFLNGGTAPLPCPDDGALRG